jgi:hypothetical protein
VAHQRVGGEERTEQPTRADDADKAAAATARWGALKKDARAVASLQVARLEALAGGVLDPRLQRLVEAGAEASRAEIEVEAAALVEPKPTRADDADKAAAATARWGALKKDARAVASLQGAVRGSASAKTPQTRRWVRWRTSGWAAKNGPNTAGLSASPIPATSRWRSTSPRRPPG